MLSVNWTVLITFALVWILALVLTRVFFKPVGRILDERAGRIDKDKSEAQAALDACDANLKRIEDGLKDARASTAEIWDRTELESLKEKGRVIAEIQTECRAQVEQAKDELNREVARLKRDIDSKTGELAEDIERRILN